MLRFTVKPGNAAECLELGTLVDGIAPRELIADKAYDSHAIRDSLAKEGILATIPPKANWKQPPAFSKDRYRARHLVENFFSHLKQFRGIATRYCKLIAHFVAFVSLAGWFLSSKRIGAGWVNVAGDRGTLP